MGRAQRTATPASLAETASSSLRSAADAFSGVFGEIRGTPQPAEDASSASYLARAHLLAKPGISPYELCKHLDFRPVLISHFVANRDIGGGWGCRRVYVGVTTDDETPPVFTVMTVDFLGTGFKRPSKENLASFQLLPDAIFHANEQLSIGPPLEDTGTLSSPDASEMSAEGFDVGFDTLTLPA
jgi:hypothetical protein